MPIKRMLKGRNFSPESAAILVKAFHSVVADLDLRTAAEKERAANIVISIAAGQTVLDGENLRDEAAGLMRNELALPAK
jgi:hypothetical protein